MEVLIYLQTDRKEDAMNILITNIGRRGYLVDFIKENADFKGKVFVSDCDNTASGLYGTNDGFFILPKPVENEILYVKSLINVCKQNNIDAVLPVIDPEIYILSNYRSNFSEEGIKVIVSDRRVLDVCFNKIKMNEFLEHIGVLYPKTYDTIQNFKSALEQGVIEFPVILKPIYGSGSIETCIVKDIRQLEILFHDGMIIQQRISGIEYGCDIFNTFEGKTIRCVIKKKIAMRSGETDKSITVKNENVKKVALYLGKKLGHIANLDCDMIEEGENVYVIDLNPRFGGGYPATHLSGVNLLSILIKLLEGKDVEPEYDDYKENLLVMKDISLKSVVLD